MIFEHTISLSNTCLGHKAIITSKSSVPFEWRLTVARSHFVGGCVCVGGGGVLHPYQAITETTVQILDLVHLLVL